MKLGSTGNICDWILLDNQFTMDISCNKNLLTNICETNNTTTIHTNDGELMTNKKGALANYGDIWYHPNVITNILSLINVTHHHCVMYDSNGVIKFIEYYIFYQFLLLFSFPGIL